MHVIIDRHLITGQNDTSTLSAVQNLILLCNARLDSKFEISFLHIEEPGNSPQAAASFLFFPWQDGGLCIGNYFIWCAKAHPLYHHVINFNSQRQHFSFVSSCVQRWGGERSFKRQQSYRPGQHFSANCQGWMGKRLLSATACI